MDTIMVTGCAGFIGSHVSEKLIKEGYSVVGIDNFDTFYPKSIKEQNIEGLKNNPNFYFYELDLREETSLDQIGEKIDIVIHLAGKAGVRPSIDDPQSYIDSNITGTKNVLDYMRKKQIKKLAFASSSSIYGNAEEVPFRESAKLDEPISPYAFTKKSCELLNHTYHYLYNLDIVNMRFFTVYGPRQRPDLAIHKFLRLLRKGESIPVFGDGTTARDYTYVNDTVKGIIQTCDYLKLHDNVFDTINLGNCFPVLLSELIDVISKEAKVEPIIERLPMQAGDVKQTYADISKAEKLIGYKPQVKFDQGIKKFVEWFDRVHS
ncbi:GDP-mannose 4,6-dehydratase [Ancylomarina sp. 16SWW S1-10-2]|uniref:GDP-mannose 4,6-dehydratase n=1 Tax=Ancylomarina sp. 16SWW S1-10-2 TaxID=2499681 RepID=UPI0012AE51CD|nr:GDP-mannose 4,6-dehydratase [Ancylomarina sp. 16SWW S1-10-2]MRT92555.1 NAD-dependent epimerase/dehydratase family protein [Ancylomarina sp. 16SWW S1-10-2]